MFSHGFCMKTALPDWISNMASVTRLTFKYGDKYFSKTPLFNFSNFFSIFNFFSDSGESSYGECQNLKVFRGDHPPEGFEWTEVVGNGDAGNGDDQIGGDDLWLNFINFCLFIINHPIFKITSGLPSFIFLVIAIYKILQKFDIITCQFDIETPVAKIRGWMVLATEFAITQLVLVARAVRPRPQPDNVVANV